MRKIVGMMRVLAWTLFLCAGLGACETLYQPPEPPVTSQVISEPPGAKIEVDGGLLGVSPLTIVWNGNYVRRFRDSSHTVKAYPIYPGQYTQIKFFHGGYTNTKLIWNGYSYTDYKTPDDSLNDPIPETIYFDMNLVPARNEYNVNIR